MGAASPGAGWPLTPAERSWSSLRLLIVLTVTAAAPWFFLIGGAIGLYLDLGMGTAAMMAGGLIGMGLVTMAIVPMATRYAVDSVASAVPQFGTRGIVLVVVPQFLSILGWNATLLVFFGDNIEKLAELAGIGATAVAVVPIATAVACLFCFIVLRLGASGIERVCQALVVLIIGVGAWLIGLLVGEHADAIAAAKPAAATADPWLNYVIGVEILIAANLSWWAYTGALARQVRRPSQAILPAMIGLGLTVPLLSIIGLASILALGTTDPSDWLASFGGPAYGAIALAFVALSNLGTVLSGAYAAALGLRQLPGLGRLSWNVVVLASLVPLLVLSTIFAAPVKAHFTTFLAFIGLAFGPICGVQIADYLILRRQRLSLGAIYDSRPGAPYTFWGGINPAAVAGLAAGVATYVLILNPLTYEPSAMFAWTTASLPAVVVAGGVHWLMTRLVVIPTGRGGYPRADR